MRNNLNCSIVTFLSALVLCAASSAFAATVVEQSIRVSAVATSSPPRIVLNWPLTPSTHPYTINRKSRDGATWAFAGSVASNVGTFTDTNVAVGGAYEYRVQQQTLETFVEYAYGYVYTGIEVPLVESRGKVLVVVDNTFTTSLAAELTRLEQDLLGDGWTPIRINVNRTDTVVTVKNLIRQQYQLDTANVKSVLLFGHVPVPYSGIRTAGPDGHTNNGDAWPADCFYGEMNGTWTDSYTSVTAAPIRAEHHNYPGDGKYDQNNIPTGMELMVGRVDLWDMPAFAPKTELDLLRQYLNKHHNFRHRITNVERRGIIDDHFGTYGGTPPFATSAWRTFAGMFGSANNAVAADWLTTLGNGGTESALWGYGCGSGQQTYASGVATTGDLAVHDTRVVFTMLFGSIFGDFNKTDNFLRAPLATTTYGLTCAWSGRPAWYFHHMGMGETIGYSTKWTQDNYNTYHGSIYTSQIQGAYMALMGDPTLRMHIVVPPSNFSGNSGGVLTWTAPAGETVVGYNVYRSTSATGPFTKLNTANITGTTYTDSSATPGSYTYMVKAIKLESGSGTYYNSSQGIFANVTISGANTPPTLTTVSTLTGATEDTAFSISYATLAAAANEADANGNPISFRVEAISSGTLTKNGTAVVAGSTLLGSGETWVWTPAANANGTQNAFTIKAWDGSAASATAVQVAVAVAAVNDVPTLTSVATLIGASEDTAFSITHATLAANANEADIDGNAISFRVEAISSGTLTKNGAAVVAGTTLLASGETLVWTPAANANGTLNAFTIKAWDGVAASATAVQIAVAVSGGNDAPTLTFVNTLYSATEDTAFSIPYATLAGSANEADIDGNAISFRIEAVSSGTLTKNGAAVVAGTTLLANGETLVWTPAANANGILNAFTVKAWDGIAASATAVQVAVSASAVNDAPFLSYVYTVNGATEDTPFTLTYATLSMYANETDIDGDALSFRVESVSSGTLTKNGAAAVAGTLLGSGESFVWTPAANSNGIWSAFTVTVWDGSAASPTPVQVTINVAVVNDPPVINSAATATPNPATAGRSVAFGVSASDADSTLTYTWTFGDGTNATGASATRTYAAAGTYNVSVSITDGVNPPAVSNITLVVNPAYTPPPRPPFTPTPPTPITTPATVETPPATDTPVVDAAATPPPPLDPAADTDGDGVTNGNEEADGTDPFDPASFAASPMTVSLLQFGVKFNAPGRDTCAVAGTVVLPQSFNPNGQTVRVNVGDATASFTLDAKGKASNTDGSIALKLPTTVNKQTKQREFAGGTVAFSVKLKGALQDNWRDEGLNPEQDIDRAMTLGVSLGLNGRVHGAQVTGLLSTKAGKSGRFKSSK